MNIFKAIGTIINSITGAVVKTAEVVDTTLDAVHDVAHMAKETTGSMRAEMAEENAQALAALKAKKSNKE